MNDMRMPRSYLVWLTLLLLYTMTGASIRWNVAAISPTSTITFGGLLRQLRKRAGMTQAHLATAASYSISLISLLERDKRQPDLEVVTQLFVPALSLYDEPGVAAHLIELAVAARCKHPSTDTIEPRSLGEVSGKTCRHAISSLGAGRSERSLPAQPNPLIGREQALVAVSRRLQGHTGRLLTLSGPPGVGKTRLALAAALQAQESYEDGTYFVPLASVHEPELVASAIASALRITQLGKNQKSLEVQLIEWLRSKQMLLLLDNFEQLTSAASLLAELLAECPKLFILVTSRERLRLRAEQCFYVPPLESESAIALFMQRAQAVAPDFALTPDRVPVIAEICQKLDGLPLAIELIAAQIPLFSPQALFALLQDHRLDLPGNGVRDLPARQQTLRSAIRHSYMLLNEGERALFRRLSVFAGSFNLQAVQGVCGDLPAVGGYLYGKAIAVPDRVNDAPEFIVRMASLLDKSLAHMETYSTHEESRFTLLETIREFAMEELQQHDEVAVLQERHAAYFTAIAKDSWRCAYGEATSFWLAWLEREYENLRAALCWCIETDPEAALSLTAALAPLWSMRGDYVEGRRWLAQALANHHAATPARAAALLAAGSLAQEQSDWTTAQQLLSESLRIFCSLDDTLGIAKVLCACGWVAYDLRLPGRAFQLFAKSLKLFRTLNSELSVAYLLATLATVMIEQTESVRYDQVHSWLQESLAIFKSFDQPQDIANVLNIQGMLETRFGSYVVAATLHSKALAILRTLSAKRDVATTLVELAEVARYQGHVGSARQYHAEAQHLFQVLDVKQGKSESFYYLGQVERCVGNFDIATQSYILGLRGGLEAEDHVLVMRCLAGLATVALARSQFVWAAQLLGAIHRQTNTFPLFLAPADRAEYVQTVNLVRANLHEGDFIQAWSQGKAMTTTQVVGWAVTVFTLNVVTLS